MALRIYMLRGCPFAHRATFSLREKNVAFEPVFFELGKRPPELEAVGAYAKSPTLFDGDDVVWDSQLVLEYIEERFPDPPLLPRDPGGRARIRMMAARVDKEVTATHGPLVMELVMKPKEQRDESKIAAAKKAVVDALTQWNEQLRDREWLVGDRFSLADIALYTPILGVKRLADIDVPPELGHLRAWLARVSARPASVMSL